MSSDAKNHRPAAAELEDELLRLNTLIRARRKQLAFLARCPNKTCECRRVWREVVEKGLANQIGVIRLRVRGKPARKAKPRARAVRAR